MRQFWMTVVGEGEQTRASAEHGRIMNRLVEWKSPVASGQQSESESVQCWQVAEAIWC